mgnify:CR=1 FL=1
MGTRSTIGMKKPDGGVVAIYCHWDGYPAHNGDILNKHWTDTDKVAQLIGLGDLSSLGTEIGEKQDFDDRLGQDDNWCLAYGRDRGERDVDARHYKNVYDWIERNMLDYTLIVQVNILLRYAVKTKLSSTATWDF